MREQILKYLDDPKGLERLYRENRSDFKKEFNILFTEIRENPTAQIWNERLNFESDEVDWGTKNELMFVIIASVIAGVMAKLPKIFGFAPEVFYPRNIGFIVFPLLIAFFLWKQNSNIKKISIVSIIIFISVIFINLLPQSDLSDTLILACIHLPLFLWTILGFVFKESNKDKFEERLNFLKYNGELIVMTAIILIAGGIFTFLTLNLFRLIDIQIEQFIFEYIGVWGLAATPIVGTYLIRSNPQLVNKVSPVIARIFTPWVLVTLLFYLVAVISTGKDPYNDREFLLIFNLLLIAVMAIIFFSIAESSKNSAGKISLIMLTSLSIVTIVVNAIALSAILFRISEWGITPNRVAVLGSNLLILLNLIAVAKRLFQSFKNQSETLNAGYSIALFLPFYSIWTSIVVFVFPFVFGFR